ncbi:MAG: VacJ family lipoprotein [Dinoroseobacter sp.]|nr:VacJ family lipoprotein [Dinoroseobacter sp.]
MKYELPRSFSRLLRSGTCAGLLLAISACATPQQPARDEINDPFESFNRSMHGFNKAIDRAFISDAARIYVTYTPEPIVLGIANFFDAAGEPLNAVNNALQGDIDGFTYSTLRFLTNATLGIVGLFDTATELGIPQDDTDFGETMFVWGIGEGPFLEVPFFGPQTTRRFVGRGVDIVIDPLGLVIGFFDGATIQATLFLLDALKLREDRRSTIDDLLYNSVDSYARARIVYLQNRRFLLGTQDGPNYFDPYVNPPAGIAPDDDFGDTYIDPYEDPYAQ